MLRRSRRAVAGSIFLVAASLPRAAAALPDLVVETANSQLGGVKEFRQVIVKAGGSIVVPAFDASDPDNTGQLHLRATLILVEPNATISAAGLGYLGKSAADGGGPGGGKVGPAQDTPGGGGAFRGIGGPGTETGSCALIGGAGGVQYGDDQTPSMGSAGGAVNLAQNAYGGGNGGGILYLEANTIRILGTLTAAGADANPSNGRGPGGGAGGTIYLRAHALELGPGASLSVVGGNGGAGAFANGGGGGGGLIVLETPAPDASFMGFVVAGGTGGSCTEGSGGTGVVTQLLDPGCLDLDQDNFDACDTTQDCDDLDPAVHAGVDDVCDGVDNDCNGTLEETCDNGAECTEVGASMVCTPIDGGTGGAQAAAAKPVGTVLSGGCSIETAGATSAAGAALGGALAALVAALVRPLGRRRRRR